MVQATTIFPVDLVGLAVFAVAGQSVIAAALMERIAAGMPRDEVNRVLEF
jgi:hypothetical protein